MGQLLIRIHQFNLSIAREPVPKIYPDITSPRVEVITFGEATVRVDGKAIAHTEWKGPLVKELFFYLLEHEPVRRELILDVFWPEYSTAKAQSVFHASLYRMRRILPKGLIRYDNEQGVYVFESGVDHWCDARAFSDLIERARAVDEPEDLLEQAAGIYHGEYLPSIYSDWCLELREVYQRNFIEALTTLATMKGKSGRFDEAASWYRKAIEVEPFQEVLHRGLMQALSDAGRHREALRQYEDLVSLLETEMSLPPAKETRALFDRIQRVAKAPR